MGGYVPVYHFILEQPVHHLPVIGAIFLFCECFDAQPKHYRSLISFHPYPEISTGLPKHHLFLLVIILVLIHQGCVPSLRDDGLHSVMICVVTLRAPLTPFT